MKKATAIVLALLMVLSLAACGSASSESKTLVMATSADYPPYEFIILNDKNEQQYVGIDISVSEAIAADMGKELQVVNMDFDSLMAGLQKGDADMVLAAIEITEERLEAADFSDPYYTDLPPMILIKADKSAEYTSLEAFSGKSVGAQTGTTKADIVTNDMPGANLVALQLVTDLVNQLMYDKVDAVVVDGSVANQYVAENDDFVIAEASSELGAAEPYCVAVQKGDPKGLLPGINEAIAKINSENKIEEFIALADSLSGVAEEVSADAPAE